MGANLGWRFPSLPGFKSGLPVLDKWLGQWRDVLNSALRSGATALQGVPLPPPSASNDKQFIQFDEETNQFRYAATGGPITIPVPTSQGGTGLTSPGTSGDVLTSNGSVWTTAPPVGPTYPISIADGGTGQITATLARGALGAAASGANGDITSLTGITTPIPVTEGGTGSGTASGARSNLGAAASGSNGDITALTGLTTPIPVTEGGTGSGTASGARSNLGAAASGANGDITSLTGLTTPLPVTEGGSGTGTIAAYGAVVGNSAGTALATVAPGTSGNVLTSNGTSWASSAAAAPSGTLNLNTVQWSPVDLSTAANSSSGSYNFNVGTQFVVRRTGVVCTGIRFGWAITSNSTVSCKLWQGGVAVATASASTTGAGIYTATFSSAYSMTNNLDYFVTVYDNTSGSPGAQYPVMNITIANAPTAPWFGGCYLDWISVNNYGAANGNPSSTASLERYPVEPVFQ